MKFQSVHNKRTAIEVRTCRSIPYPEQLHNFELWDTLDSFLGAIISFFTLSASTVSASTGIRNNHSTEFVPTSFPFRFRLSGSYISTFHP